MIRRIAVAALVAASATGTAWAAPAVTSGWPRPVPGGSVHRTLAGGPAVIGQLGDAFAVSAFSLSGTRLWSTWRSPGCGNCDDGPQAPDLQADGTYGPIGVEGDDFWNVSQAGAIVPGCSGVVLADGTCIAWAGTFLPSPSFLAVPVLRATRAGATLWEYREPDFSWEPDSGVPPLVVRDGAGTVYVAFGPGTTQSTKAAAPARMLAVDGATGILRWRQIGATPLAALPQGVVASTVAGLTAYDGAGALLWNSAVAQGTSAGALPPAVQTGPGRVYVGTGSAIVALDAATGAEVWRTAAADRARLLSVSPAGTVLAAVDRGGRTGLRAITPAGRGAWQLDTATEVLGARELADGTVALDTAGRMNGMGDLLLRVDPGRKAAVPRRPQVTLSRTTVRTRCSTQTCDIALGAGTILRMDLPRPATATVTIRERSGRPTPGLVVRSVSLTPGAGPSFVRLLVGENRLARGPHLVSVRWRDRAGTNRRNIPIVVR